MEEEEEPLLVLQPRYDMPSRVWGYVSGTCCRVDWWYHSRDLRVTVPPRQHRGAWLMPDGGGGGAAAAERSVARGLARVARDCAIHDYAVSMVDVHEWQAPCIDAIVASVGRTLRVLQLFAVNAECFPVSACRGLVNLFILELTRNPRLRRLPFEVGGMRSLGRVECDTLERWPPSLLRISDAWYTDGRGRIQSCENPTYANFTQFQLLHGRRNLLACAEAPIEAVYALYALHRRHRLLGKRVPRPFVRAMAEYVLRSAGDHDAGWPPAPLLLTNQ